MVSDVILRYCVFPNKELLENRFSVYSEQFLQVFQNQLSHFSAFQCGKLWMAHSADIISKGDISVGRAVVELTIEKLQKYGYLDDAEYARVYVSVNGRAKGERRLAAELKSKGVSAEHIAAALDGFDGFDKALGLARRHSRGKDLDDQGYLAKLGNYLLYRGYGWEDVSRCVAALKKEREDE